MNRKSIAFMTIASMLAGTAVPAGASVNVQTHHSVANSRYVKTEAAGAPAAGTLFFGLDYNWLNDPLVELNPTRERRLDTLVESVQSLDLTTGYQLTDKLSLNATLPLHWVNLSDSGREAALGDSRVFSRIGLLGGNTVAHVAIIPELWLPTGNRSLFMSDGALGYGATLAIERDFGYFRAAANLGYRLTSGGQFREIDYRRRLPLSLALGVPLNPRWQMNLEASQTRVLPLNRYQNPGEFYAGLRYQAAPGLALTGGAAMGAMNGVASQDYRMMLGLRFTTQVREPASPVFRDEMRVSQASAARIEGDQIVIDDEIPFEHDSAELLPPARPVLDEVARVLVANRGRVRALDVEGHCNELGSDEYNVALGERRARAVVAYLRSRGVPAKLLRPVSYGERRPKAREARMSRAEWLRINRRTEFRIRTEGA